MLSQTRFGSALPQHSTLSAFFACVGNSEAKLLMQLMVHPGEMLDAADLRARFETLQDPHMAVRYAAGNAIFRRLTDCHVPVGLFEKAQVGRKVLLWKKRDNCQVGDTLAGHLLTLSANTTYALRELFGPTASARVDYRRPAYFRLALYHALAHLGPDRGISLPKLSEVLGVEEKLIHKHVSHMATLGLLHYFAAVGERPVLYLIRHTSPSTKLVYTRRMSKPVLYGGVYSGRITDRRLAAGFLQQRQAAGKLEFEREHLTAYLESETAIIFEPHRVRRVIRQLIEEGAVQRLPLRPGSDLGGWSAVSVDETQWSIAKKIDDIRAKLASGSAGFVTEGRRLARRILDDPAVVGTLLQKEAAKSPDRSRRPLATTVRQITELLKKRPDLTTREIASIIDEGRLSVAGMGNVLRIMRKAGDVTARKEGTTSYWSLRRSAA